MTSNLPVKRTYLTQREREVLIELAKDGPTNAEIGRRLFLSEATVKWHISGAFAISGVKGRVALVLWWIRVGQYQDQGNGRSWQEPK